MPCFKALILVGGYGTRLRPLTLSRTKPAIPFCNKPMVIHQIEALAKKNNCIIVDEFQKGIRIEFSQENEPLGTAGPLALARNLLKNSETDEDPFFVLNSDISSNFPFDDLINFHLNHKKDGSIFVTTVSDPSKYGVVVYEKKSGRISEFIEKPQEYVGNKINAGIYIFNTRILDSIELQPTSIERDVFPRMAKEGQLYALELKGFWMDIGQPKDYLCGMIQYLSNLQKFESDVLAQGIRIISPVIIDPTAKIGIGCLIGPYVSIGANCMIEDGVRLKRTAVFDDVRIKAHTSADSAIIGWGCNIGKWVRLENSTVLGMDVKIYDEIFINGAKILPHKIISETILDPTAIIM